MSTDQTCNSSFWSKEDKILEDTLAIYFTDGGDLFTKMEEALPWKSRDDIISHYKILLEDVEAIDSGRVPLPNYPEMQSYSNQKSRCSKTDLQWRRGVAWTKEEHRSFTEADSIEQNPSAGDAELSLVVFNVHDSYNGCLLQRSGWTRDIAMFFQYLSDIPFSNGGDFNNVAVAEGLAEALMMFSSLNGSQTQQNAEGQRHCILVSASNPHLLPTPVYGPVMQILEWSGNIEAHTSNGLADAETVAKAFPQCSVSLSIICPRKLPKLRAIYNAGKRDHQAADPPVDTSNNPSFLVLISENFNKACAAFSRTEMESLAPNQSLVEIDMSSVPPVSGPTATSDPSVMDQRPISAVLTSGRQGVTSMTGFAPFGRTSQIAQNSIAVLTSRQLGVTSMSGFAPFARTDQIAQNSVPVSLTSMSPSMFGNSNLRISQLLSNIQGGTGAGSQTTPVLSRGNDAKQDRHVPSQMMQRGICMHQSMPSGTVAGMSSGIGRMMATPGRTLQGQLGIFPLGRNNSAEANMSLSQQQTLATLPAAQSDYVIFWEGNIYTPRSSEPLRLQGYKRRSASELLTANWPPTMQIHCLISKNKLFGERIRRADHVIFRVMEPHTLLSHLQEKNWYAVISLPSQTLYLGVFDNNISRLIGYLFPSENAELRPTIPNQPQQQRAESLLEQLQQQKRKNDVALQPPTKTRRMY